MLGSVAPVALGRYQLDLTAKQKQPVRFKATVQATKAGAPQEIRDLWKAITPMARWEWVRWVGATKNASTRQRRVEVSISKLSDGKRRPCCFNLASCTDPELARSGKLALS